MQKVLVKEAWFADKESNKDYKWKLFMFFHSKVKSNQSATILDLSVLFQPQNWQ